MTYQRVKPLSAAKIQTLATVTDPKKLPAIPVEVIDSKIQLGFLDKVREYYHTASVLVMGVILYWIDYGPGISEMLPDEWQTGLSVATVIATFIFNFFKSNDLWIKRALEVQNDDR